MIFNVPPSFSFPVSIAIPTSPVLLKILIRNPSVIPVTPVPMVVSAIPSPAEVYIIIGIRDVPVINPIPIVIT